MSINTAFTALADAIRDKSGVSGALTVAGMTDAVNGIVINPGGGGSDIDFTGVTVTADKLLNGVVAINKNGQKITGTIQNGSVRQDGAEITVSAGYYATDQLIELPISNIYTDGGSFFAGQGYVAEDKEITIPDATVTETETSVTVSPGYVGEELNFELGTPGSNVEYGYIDSDGKIQKLDLSGDAPIDSGTPVEMPIFAFATGQNEPAYDGGGGGSIDFYECSEVGTDSWSGYLMEQDDKGNWSATDQLRTDMPIQGFVPAVNYCYNENTTVIADLYSSDIFIQPFNVDAISYTGGPDEAVTWTYADGSIAYCSKYRIDWSIEEGGVFNIPAAGVPDSGWVEIAGNNNDFYWYFAWTNQSPVVVKGLQFMPGYGAQYGTVNFDVEGCDENSPDNSNWTTLASFTANKSTDYGKINYYSLKSNETAYKWYRIRVKSINTLPYIAYLSVFSKDIKKVYGVV